MLRHSFALATLLFAASTFGCTIAESNDTDAGTEPDAELPDASLPDPTGFFQVALGGGRGDGEDNNFGLVTVGDEPYDDFVDPVTVTNLRAPHLGL